jgi:hypothetical protein
MRNEHTALQALENLVDYYVQTRKGGQTMGIPLTPMSIGEIITLMKSSKSQFEWDENVKKVKRSYSGRMPDFWQKQIIESGLYGAVLGKFSKAEKKEG